ncbi:hypothetical protein MHU86_20396 [Fragilaria crotonensis]|nr:hypothetical protein MHU86_20396 [Fragilaria crotonensis]
MIIPTKLERWALDIANLYLQTHLPSALSVDTTDPRSARRIYDEDEIMEDDDSTDKKLPAADNWTPVHGKTKRHTTEALDTQLPDSPIRHSHSPPVPIAQMANPSTVHPNSTQPTPAATTNGLNFVRINDGTLRVTVRWKPEKYNNISDNKEQWNLAATDTIHYILETVSDAILFPWRNGSNIPHIPLWN